jgi:hypothetical protein
LELDLWPEPAPESGRTGHAHMQVGELVVANQGVVCVHQPNSTQ